MLQNISEPGSGGMHPFCLRLGRLTVVSKKGNHEVVAQCQEKHGVAEEI